MSYIVLILFVFVRAKIQVIVVRVQPIYTLSSIRLQYTLWLTQNEYNIKFKCRSMALDKKCKW
jgi:hypothetical protein